MSYFNTNNGKEEELKKEAGRTVETAKEVARDKADELSAKAGAAFDNTKDNVSEAATRTIDQASRKIDEMSEAARDTLDTAREKAGRMYNRGNLALVRNTDPIPSLAIAAALGFLAGYALNAGSRRS
ncbi:apolipoprotein A1/A4/E family protein [Ancylobacter sp. 6x-1]|uniref:Apolipoprotein A1/A4/E family protein n=1 Tax=Ancylobacter crimeensis TaxID=2579147 RepID=A0ABT0DAE1_9HYPH|nr:apolipoprotein A1/A4/E family protein [Ancylobacter crimeensis]MCK0196933.1 apolipoprotein A1/A4/E family protein [Ancylobacter crimeensis]